MFLDGYTFEMYEAEQDRLERLEEREQYELEVADREEWKDEV